MDKKLYVIGIGFRPLDERAKAVLFNSSYVLLNDRLHEVIKRYDEYEVIKGKVKVINNVDETMNFIRTEVQKSGSRVEDKKSLTSRPQGLGSVVLIAEGDPMFFGIGKRIVEEFGKEDIEIYPDLSSMQVAFSRIKEAWSDAFLMSLHGGPDPTKRRKLEYEMDDIPLLLQRYHKIGILTDKENNPAEVAKRILKADPLLSTTLTMFVCERLGYPDEKIIEGRPEEVAGMNFLTPNVLIILSENMEGRS